MIVAVVIVAVVIVIVLVEAVAEEEIVVDRRAVRIDDLDAVQQPLERLRFAQLCGELDHGIVALVGLAHLVRLLVDPHGDPLVLALEVVVVGHEVLRRRDGPQRQVDLDRAHGAFPHAFGERGGVLTGGGKPLLDLDALRLHLGDEVLDAGLQLGGHERFGRFLVDELGEARGRAVDQHRAGLVELRLAEPRPDRVGPLVDGVELTEVVAHPLVGDLGQDHLLHLGDRDGEVGRLFGTRRRGRERELVTGGGPVELVVEAFGHPSLTDLVRPVLDVQPGDGLAIATGGQVERDEVAGGGGPIEVGERAVAGPLGVDRRLHVVVRGGYGGQLHPKAAVARHAHDRAHLARGIERDLALISSTGQLDFGRGDEVDVVLAHGAGEVLRDRVLQRLLPGGVETDAGLEDPPGALPGRKPGRRTSLAIFLKAESTARSNSASSTSTDNLTLLPSRGSSVLFTGSRVYRRGVPWH